MASLPTPLTSFITFFSTRGLFIRNMHFSPDNVPLSK